MKLSEKLMRDLADRKLVKRAATAPPPMDPSGMPASAPQPAVPTDPSAMGATAQVPTDPSMAQMAPGAMPAMPVPGMDPSMAGAAMPPMDPAMLQALTQSMLPGQAPAPPMPTMPPAEEAPPIEEEQASDASAKLLEKIEELSAKLDDISERFKAIENSRDEDKTWSALDLSKAPDPEPEPVPEEANGRSLIGKVLDRMNRKTGK